jgi:hypothetical protein
MLQKCNLIIKHIEGKDNAIADAFAVVFFCGFMEKY